MRTSDRSTAAMRGRVVCGAALMAMLLVLVPVASASASDGVPAASPALAAPGRTAAHASVPPPTDNEFIPADQNLSSCVGTLELPNCGSPAKSDVRLYLTFAVLMLGMAFIGWRITVAVRRRDRTQPEPDHTF